jgi:hypothetical protein
MDLLSGVLTARCNGSRFRCSWQFTMNSVTMLMTAHTTEGRGGSGAEWAMGRWDQTVTTPQLGHSSKGSVAPRMNRGF